MRVLHLSTLASKPNVEGENKIKRSKEGKGESKDKYGRTKSWYLENGFDIPLDLFEDSEEKDLEYDEEGFLVLDNHEVDFEAFPTVLVLKEFSFAIDNENLGSSVFTKGGEIIQVLETSFEIYAQIEWMERSWISKQLVNLKYWIQEKLKKKELTVEE